MTRERIIVVRGQIVRRAGATVICHEPYAITRNGRTAYFQTHDRASLSFRLCATLATGCGGIVLHKDITEALYGDQNDGGPFNPANTVAQLLLRCADRLQALGLGVKVVYRFGYEVFDVSGETRAAA